MLMNHHRNGLGILVALLRGRHEPWDRPQVAEVRLKAAEASGSERTLSEAGKRLRAALTELSYSGATTYKLIRNLIRNGFLQSCLQWPHTPFAASVVGVPGSGGL